MQWSNLYFKIFLKDDANEDDEKRCFICGIERSEFDKRNKVSIHEFCDYYGWLLWRILKIM